MKEINMRINPELNICIVKTNTTTGEKTWHYGKNIVTNDGDLYYAQQAVEATPTSDFGGSNGRMELRTGTVTPAKGDAFQQVTTPIAASIKVKDSGYPKTNDDDSDNTGSGTDIVTWRTSWTTGDFNATAIIGGCFIALPIRARIVAIPIIKASSKISSPILLILGKTILNTFRMV